MSAFGFNIQTSGVSPEAIFEAVTGLPTLWPLHLISRVAL